MVDTIPLLSKLFAGIPRQDGVALMNEMGATIRKIPAGGIVLREGSLKRNIGVLLDGSLEMYETDVDGHRSMVGMVYPQESFALVFAFAAVERHPATAAAVEDRQASCQYHWLDGPIYLISETTGHERKTTK